MSAGREVYGEESDAGEASLVPSCTPKSGAHVGSPRVLRTTGRFGIIQLIADLLAGRKGCVAAALCQNGFTITRMTMPIISSVGASLTIRQCRVGLVLRSSAKALTAAEK